MGIDVNKYEIGDCLKLMQRLPDKSIDAIICDLPQQITRNKWDIIIPFRELWEQYERIIVDNGAIVLFGNQPFTSKLILSNERLFRYSMVWHKTTSTGFLNAKKMPLRSHEDICVFYKKLPVYNPQKTTGHKPVNNYTKHSSDGSNYGQTKIGVSGGGSTERYPTSVIKWTTDKQKSAIHSTQKPVGLMEWIVRTYTNPGMVVLDNAAGSGSTAIACINTDRKYVCMEKDVKIGANGKQRIEDHKQ